MLKWFSCALGILALSGCGIPEYFDQHPANVRTMSSDDNSAGAPTENEVAPMTASTPQAAGAASPAAPESPVQPAQPAPPALSGATSQALTEETPRASSAVPVPSATSVVAQPEQPAPPAMSGTTSQAFTAETPPVPSAAVPETPASATSVVAQPGQPAPPAMSGTTSQAFTAETPPVPSAAAPGTPASAASVVTQPTATKDCNAVATARAEDAAANGYDEDLQQVVHDKTYADCVAWNSTHP